MARIDLPEPYAVRQARYAIRDSLMSHGEECILMHMYHVNEVQDIVPRCPLCFDDVYNAGDKYNCPRCYGTTFDGGVKDVYRSWGLFGDNVDEENFSKRGIWHPVSRNLHTEGFPDLWQRDYVVRVNAWSADHRPLSIEGIYVCKEVTNETLRTGNHYGQNQLHTIGQRADLEEIAHQMPINLYPFSSTVFNRWDGRVR